MGEGRPRTRPTFQPPTMRRVALLAAILSYLRIGILTTWRHQRMVRNMATRLSCRVGRHAWKRKWNDEGRPYVDCARCGKCAELGAGYWVGVSKAGG